MNFAVVATGLNYDDRIGKGVFRSPCLFIFDGRQQRFEAIVNPLARQAGMQEKIRFILLLRRYRVSHLLVRQCAEDLRILLEKFEITIRDSVNGSIGDIVSHIQRTAAASSGPRIISENIPPKYLLTAHLNR